MHTNLMIACRCADAISGYTHSLFARDQTATDTAQCWLTNRVPYPKEAAFFDACETVLVFDCLLQVVRGGSSSAGCCGFGGNESCWLPSLLVCVPSRVAFCASSSPDSRRVSHPRHFAAALRCAPIAEATYPATLPYQTGRAAPP